jgi:hypothetical protein
MECEAGRCTLTNVSDKPDAYFTCSSHLQDKDQGVTFITI